MKMCTTLEQSKYLAEILPKESADMIWKHIDDIPYYCLDLIPYDLYSGVAIPAWSLDALLFYLKRKYFVRLEHDGVSWSITCIEHDTDKKYTSVMFDEPLDACWGMILRLKGEGKL